MKILLKSLKWIAFVALLIIMVLVIWQPVFPSGKIVEGMVDAIDPSKITMDLPKAVQFELSGKGGGVYSLLVTIDEAKFLKGRAEQADLIIYMEATDFNSLMMAMAQGKADAFTFQSAIISNTLKFAGDMGVFSGLFAQ
jgi:putative sterol carrier protein